MECTYHINKQRMSPSSVIAATTSLRPGEPWGISGRKEYLLSSSHHRFPDSSAVKNPPAMQETWFNFWVQEIPWRRDRLPTPVFLGFPGSLAGKESTCNVEDLGSIPGLGRSPGGGHGNPLQNSCLENPQGQESGRLQSVGLQKAGHN